MNDASVDHPVHVTAERPVSTITLDHPPANPLGDAVLAGLDAALAAAAAAEAKVVVVASAVEGFFAAGADIKQMVDLDARAFQAYHHAMRATFATLAGGPFLSVAAIDGVAFGGGLELALACTLRVATPRSRLGLPESKLGLLPAAGGTQRLPRVVGRGRAMDLILTGRTLRGEEAHAIGLVDRLAPDGEAAGSARALAGELAALSLPALHAIQRCVDAALDRPFDQGLAIETDAFLGLLEHGEIGEGLRAFLDRRRPRFA